MSSKKELLVIFIIFLVAGTLRFYNLMHDEPYFFNPDERNMAAAITQLRMPNKFSKIPACIFSELTTNCNLNPRFFAYGQFPLYLAYISDQTSSVMLNHVIPNLFRDPIGTLKQVQGDTKVSVRDDVLTTNFPSAILWLRFWSALSSTLTVLMVFLVSRQLFSFRLSLISSLFTAFTPGLIQSAHFGTTESLLTFFFTISIYLALKQLRTLPNPKSKSSIILNSKFFLLNSIIVGMAFGSKLTGLFCLFPPFIGYLIQIIRLIKSKISKLKKFISLLDYWIIGIIFVLLTIIFCIIFSPYNLIDQKEFLGSVFGYEQDVATGRYEAFYTRQFTNTLPILFQMQKVFPYALGWPVFLLGTAGFMLMTASLLSQLIIKAYRNIKYKVLNIKKNKRINNIINTKFLILTASFIFYLLPNAFLFAKWTRFMTPILPFFAIFAGYLIFRLMESVKRKAISSNINFSVLHAVIIIIAILPGIAFFSIYTKPDSRIQASEWIYENIPNNSYLFSETANVIDIPLGMPQYRNKNYHLVGFDFYNMDINPTIFETLPVHLEKADYILIPSRRIFANHMPQFKKYPLTTKYYQLLFSGRLGFEKVAEIKSYPSLEIGNWKLEIGDEQSEETSTVFDHPVIRIYKKTLPFYAQQYKRMLTN